VGRVDVVVVDDQAAPRTRLKPSGTSARTVTIAFAAFFAVFLVTHVVKFPGSVPYLKEMSRGQRMLDMQPSFSAADTYDRLEAFGPEGRQAYRRTILTVDVVFPVVFFLFLFAWARHVAPSRVGPRLARAVAAPAVVYFLADLVENAAILAMLAQFPERLSVLAASIGYVTVTKRVCMIIALLAPPGLLLATAVRRRRRAGQ
jgi:hypothetical protein